MALVYNGSHQEENDDERKLIIMATTSGTPFFKGMDNDEVTDKITDIMEQYDLCVTDTDFYDAGNGITIFIETGNTYSGVDVSMDFTRDITETEFYRQAGLELTEWDAREWCVEHIGEVEGPGDVYDLIHDADNDAEVFHESGEKMLAHYRELRNA